MKLIDTHSHLYLEEFASDIENVITTAQEKNISRIILPNVDYSTLEDMFILADKYPGYLFPLAGLHPTSVDKDYTKYLKLIEEEIGIRKIYGIGEIGIDLYWDKTYRKEQILVFEEQLKWSKELNLPVSIHTREAFPEVLESIHKVGSKGLKGVFHSFTGSTEELKEVLKLEDFYLGINGVVTFKNSKLSEVLSNTTLDKIMLETDAPYLSPVPYRGKRNEPAYLWNTAEKIGEIFDTEISTVAEVTTKNALNLFTLA